MFEISTETVDACSTLMGFKRCKSLILFKGVGWKHISNDGMKMQFFQSINDPTDCITETTLIYMVTNFLRKELGDFKNSASCSKKKTHHCLRTVQRKCIQCHPTCWKALKSSMKGLRVANVELKVRGVCHSLGNKGKKNGL